MNMLKTRINKINVPKAFAVTATIIAIATMASVVLLTNAEQTSAQRTITLYDGDLIKSPNSSDVYIVKYINNKWFKRLILNPQIFNSYNHLSWDNIRLVSQSTVDRHTNSHLVMEVYSNGQPVNGMVYYLRSLPGSDIGIKHHVNMSPSEFETVGLDWDSIYRINHTEAGDGFYAEGEAITRNNFRDVINSQILVTAQSNNIFNQNNTTTTSQNNDTDDEDQEDNNTLPKFKITRSSNISSVDIKQDQEKNVAQYTVTSKENDSKIDDITLLFEAKGGSSKNHDIEDTFSEISLILDGDEISTISTEDDEDKIKSSSKKHKIKFAIDDYARIREDDSVSLQVRVETKEDLESEHYQEWTVKIDDIDLIGNHKSKTVTSLSRKFTVSETIEPFLNINSTQIEDSLLTPSTINNRTKLLQITIDNEKQGTQYNSTITEIKVQLKLNNNESSLGLRDVMKSISLQNDLGRIISGSQKSITTSSTSRTITFSNLSIKVGNNSQEVIDVYADLQPLIAKYKTTTNIDSTLELTADSDDIKATYTSSKNKINDNRITGDADSVLYQLLSSGRISSTLLNTPTNPKVTTENLSVVATARVQMTAQNGQINTIKVALNSTSSSSNKLYEHISKIQIAWDNTSVERTISSARSYTKSGNNYIVTFSNLGIDLESNDSKEISISLQAKETHKNLSSTNWRIAPIDRFITARIGNTIKYAPITSSKSFSIQGSTGNTEFITIENSNAALGSKTVNISTSQHTSKTVLASIIRNSSDNKDYDVDIDEITVNLQGSGDHNLRNIIESVSICLIQDETHCSSRSSEFISALQSGKTTSISSTRSATDVRLSNLKNIIINEGRSRTIYVMLTFKPQSRGVNETIVATIDGSKIKGEFRNTSINLNSNQVGGDSSSETYILKTTDSISAKYEKITPTPHISTTSLTSVTKIKVYSGLYTTELENMNLHITGASNLSSYFTAIKLVSSNSKEITGTMSGNLVYFRDLGSISARSNKTYTLKVQARNPSVQDIQEWEISISTNGIVGLSNNIRKYTAPEGTASFTLGSSVFITLSSDTPSKKSFKTDSEITVDLLKFTLENRSSSSKSGYSIPVSLTISNAGGSSNIDDIVKSVKLVEGSKTIGTKTIGSTTLNSQTLTFDSIKVSGRSSRVFKVVATIHPRLDENGNRNYETEASLTAKVDNVQNIPGSAIGNTMTFINLDKPRVVTSVINSSKVYLSWNRIPGASGYTIERCKKTSSQINNNENCTNFRSSTRVRNGSTTSKTITGLSGSSSYVFRIRAYDASNNLGPWSETIVSDTDLLAPRMSTPKVDGIIVNLSWNTIATAENYNVKVCQYESNNSSCNAFDTIGNNEEGIHIASEEDLENTSENLQAIKEDGNIKVAGLKENTKYAFRVRANRTQSPTFSDWSNTVSATTKITKPHNLRIMYETDHEGRGTSDVAIIWKSSGQQGQPAGIQDEAQYCKTRNNRCITSYVTITPQEIQAYRNNKKYILLDSKGQGETFMLRVRSRTPNRNYYTQWASIVVRTNMAKAQNLEGEWKGGAVDITWDAVNGADYYEIWFCVKQNWQTASILHIRDESNNKKAARIIIPEELYTGDASDARIINVKVRALRDKLTPNEDENDLYHNEPTIAEWSNVNGEIDSSDNTQDLDILIER